MSKAIIEVEGLSKRYQLGAIGVTSLRESFERLWRPKRAGTPTGAKGEFWALKDVSFSIQPGEVVGVIGSNGAGKSTLLKILSRITEPTSGRAILRGRVASLLEVGTGFHPDLTGRENIFLNGAILGMTRSEIRSRFDEIVAFAEVEQFIDTPVKRYSSGMYVRLAFAVAAHLEPEILIVDEVLAVGDAQFQQKCLGKMQEVSESHGRTVIFVSHNMATVGKLCQRGILLQKGSVAYAGPASGAIQEYFSSTALSLDSAAGIRRTAVSSTEAAKLRIVRGWIERGRQPSTQFVHGDDNVDVVIVVELTSPCTFAVELVLRDSLLHPIAFAPGGLVQNADFRGSPGSYLVRCRLPALALAQGGYSIDVIAADSGVAVLDHIEGALRFSIEPTALGNRNWNFVQEIGRGCMLWNVDFSTPIPVPNGK